MKSLRFLLPFLLIAPLFGQIPDQNLFVTAGTLAGQDKGDSLYRAIFFVGVPQNYAGKIYFRIFDADLGGKNDNVVVNAATRFQIFGKGNITWNLFGIADSVKGKPLFDLQLGDDRYYDNRWRSLAFFGKEQGELRDGLVYFQLVIDGLADAGVNIYQPAFSTQDKENEPIPGIQVYSPALSIRISERKDLATQIRLIVPAGTRYLTMTNFDADDVRSPNMIKFQTNFRNNIVLPLSQDGKGASVDIPIQEMERGQPAAIVIESNTEPNNIQFWVSNDRGEIVPLLFPSLVAPVNILPVPVVTMTPLSECNTVMLDASQSKDDNGDELSFRWIFPDGKSETGSRIVHNFGKPGKYDVQLAVSDNSGFVANTSRTTQVVIINYPPQSKIACQKNGFPGELINFDGSGSTDTDGTIIKLLWDFGDGKKEYGDKVTHVFYRPGRYDVTLSVEDNSGAICNNNKSTRKIWINDAPVPKLNLGKDIAAVAESVTIDANGSIDSDGDIVRYAWDFNDGQKAEGQVVSHAYARPGVYEVRLDVYDDADVTNSLVREKKTIVINSVPVPAFNFRPVVAANEKVDFDGTLSGDTDGFITQYRWDMGDGATLQGGHIDHKYAKPGTYTVKLRVIDNTATLNNSAEISGKIRVNDPPVADAGGNRMINSSIVEFDGSKSTDSDDPIIDYTWDFGDGVNGSGIQTKHIYTYPGKYNVTLYVTDKSGTISARQSNIVEINVNYPPVADAGRDQIIAFGEKIKFNGGFARDPDGKIVNYKWEVEDGVFLEGKSIEYQYKKPGFYQVALTIKDNDGAEDIHYTSVFVNAAPVPLIAPITRIAPLQSITCDGSLSTDTDGRITFSEWDFGDGSQSATGLKVKHTYQNPGRYTLKLKVRDNTSTTNNTVSTTQVIAVNYPPEPNAGKDILTCEQMVTFDASNSTDADQDVLGYFWDFGDGATGGGAKVAHNYGVPGIYPVTLRVDDNQGISNSIRQTIIKVHVNSAPHALISANRDTVCAGESLMLNASQSWDNEKGLLRYLWNFGDGVTAEGVNQIHAYKTGGDFMVNLKVMDDSNLPCNTSMAEKLVHVIDAPVADAGTDQEVCANTIVQFDASKSTGGGRTIKSFDWDFGDGEKGGGISPTHAYAKPGAYAVRVTITVADIGDCENSSDAVIMIAVISAPTAHFKVNNEGCASEDLKFDASQSFAENAKIIEYNWNFGDGTTGKGVVVNHKYAKPGIYKIDLKVRTDSNKGCNAAQADGIVTINAQPQAVIEVYAADEKPTGAATYQTYVGSLLNFSADKSRDSDGMIKKYQWNFGDGSKDNGLSTQHQYKTAGTYLAILKVEDNSQTYCNGSYDTLKIVVLDQPLIRIDAPAVAFVNQSVGFNTVIDKNQNATDASTTWIFGDGETLNGLNVKKMFTKSGKFQVQVKVGGRVSLAQQIIIYDMPIVTIPDAVTVDFGETVSLSPIINNPFNTPVKLQWDMGDGTKFDQGTASYKYKQAGQYTARLSIFYKEIGSGQPKIIDLPVKVNPVPQVLIETRPEKVFAGGARDEVFFIANTTGYIGLLNFQWDFGDGITATGRFVKHTFAQAGKYKVTVTVWDATRADAKKYTYTRELVVTKR